MVAKEGEPWTLAYPGMPEATLDFTSLTFSIWLCHSLSKELWSAKGMAFFSHERPSLGALNHIRAAKVCMWLCWQKFNGWSYCLQVCCPDASLLFLCQVISWYPRIYPFLNDWCWLFWLWLTVAHASPSTENETVELRNYFKTVFGRRRTRNCQVNISYLKVFTKPKWKEDSVCAPPSQQSETEKGELSLLADFGVFLI